MAAELTPRERFGLLLIDELPDRVVTYPLVTSHAAAVYGCTVGEYCTDGLIMGKAQAAAWRQYRHDAVSIFSEVGIIAEAFGSEYEIREEDVPILIRPCIEGIETIEGLRIPDPEKDGRLPLYLDAIDHCYDTVGDVVPVIAYIPAPFTTAAQLRGIDLFLMDTIRAPEAAHLLLDAAAQAAVRLIDVCMEHGAHPMLVDPLASCSVISPRIFAQFAAPYLKKLIDFMRRYDLDTMLHICGETELSLDAVGETGVDLFSFDKNGRSATRERLGSAIRLIGNVSPQEMLLAGSGDIYDSVKNTITAMKDTPKGFVMATGCEVPIRTPADNVHAFVAASHEFGKYDFG